VRPGAGEVHGKQREALEDALNEGGSLRTHVRLGRPMYAVKQLAGGDI